MKNKKRERTDFTGGFKKSHLFNNILLASASLTDRTFRNFGVLKFVDRRFWRISSIVGLGGYKVVKMFGQVSCVIIGTQFSTKAAACSVGTHMLQVISCLSDRFFGVSKSIARHFWTIQNSPISWSRGSKIVTRAHRVRITTKVRAYKCSIHKSLSGPNSRKEGVRPSSLIRDPRR